MKPIDAIRNKLDYDFHKYTNFSTCEILNVSKIKGIGMLLEVTPKGPDDKILKEPGEKTIFNVVCLNKSQWWEWNIKEKYNVVVMSSIKNRPAISPGFLIPKTMVESFDDWSEDDEKRLFSEKRENIHMQEVCIEKEKEQL